VEGVNSSMIYLMSTKNLYKCHTVSTQHNNKEKKTKSGKTQVVTVIEQNNNRKQTLILTMSLALKEPTYFIGNYSQTFQSEYYFLANITVRKLKSVVIVI
jgi:hypothetical protein